MVATSLVMVATSIIVITTTSLLVQVPSGSTSLWLNFPLAQLFSGSTSRGLARPGVNEALLGGEQAWTPNLYLKSFDMDSVQVGKAVFGKEIYTTLGIEPRNYSNPGSSGNPYSVCWVKKH